MNKQGHNSYLLGRDTPYEKVVFFGINKKFWFNKLIKGPANTFEAVMSSRGRQVLTKAKKKCEDYVIALRIL